SITPQLLKLATDFKTLNNLQRLLGTVNWVRPYLRISTKTLAPLFNTLKGDMDLTSP
ncbi:POK6 protein, partial [Rhynochetos jubatus]|nr:POK6 protein [Rhynochetos jubatus]